MGESIIGVHAAAGVLRGESLGARPRRQGGPTVLRGASGSLGTLEKGSCGPDAKVGFETASGSARG